MTENKNCNDKIKKFENWSENASLYEPYESEQVLLAENASCLSVKVYLKMCGLPYRLESCINAEFMTPGGRLTKLPILQVGSFIVAEFEPIGAFIEQKGFGIDNWLEESERFEMRTYLTMTENILTMAELYVSFIIDSVYRQVTSQRIRWAHPWPLGLLRTYVKRQQFIKILKVYQWNDKSIDDVIRDVCKCCEMLQMLLASSNGPFFYGEKPCSLDALVFGHTFAILTTNLPNMVLAHNVCRFAPLLAFCRFIESKYFNSQLLNSSLQAATNGSDRKNN